MHLVVTYSNKRIGAIRVAVVTTFSAVAERYLSVVVESGRTVEKLLRDDNSIVQILVVNRSAVYVNLPFEFRPQGLPVALKDGTQIVVFAPTGSYFVIDLPTRRMEIAGIAPIPDILWLPPLERPHPGLGDRLIDGVPEAAPGRVGRGQSPPIRRYLSRSCA